MLEYVFYENEPMRKMNIMRTKTPKKLGKVKGFLLKSIPECEGPFFRIYNYKNDSFKDYRIAHDDLQIEINDEDAYVYHDKKGELVIDYSPKTLGIDDKNKTKRKKKEKVV